MEGFCDSPDLPRLDRAAGREREGAGRDGPHQPVAQPAAEAAAPAARQLARRARSATSTPTTTSATSFYGLWLDPTMTYSSALYDGDDGTSRSRPRRPPSTSASSTRSAPSRATASWRSAAAGAASPRPRRGAACASPASRSPGSSSTTPARAWSAPASPTGSTCSSATIATSRASYDHIVSIEMVEAVGERYWPDYFAALKRHVAPGGSALVQAIVIADDFFEGYRRRPDFIQTYIFPGGMLLSPPALRRAMPPGRAEDRRALQFRPGLCPHAGDLARPLRRGRRPGRPSWASTSASAACGAITSPIAPPASRPAARTFCRRTSGIYKGRTTKSVRKGVREQEG